MRVGKYGKNINANCGKFYEVGKWGDVTFISEEGLEKLNYFRYEDFGQPVRESYIEVRFEGGDGDSNVNKEDRLFQESLA